MKFKKKLFPLWYYRDEEGKLRAKGLVLLTPIKEVENEKETRNNKRGYFERDFKVS